MRIAASTDYVIKSTYEKEIVATQIKKHDQFVKLNLENRDIAKTFVKLHAPKYILKKCNLKTLEICPNSHIDENLKTSCSDIVYKIKTKDDRDYIYVYVLVEHQSTPDEWMPIRILGYQLEVIKTHAKTYGLKDGIPLVVPLVLYNGEVSPYPYKCDVADMFMDREMYEQVGLGKFNLVDLSIINDDELLKHGKAAVLEVLAKHMTLRDSFNFNLNNAVTKAIIEGLNSRLPGAIFNAALTYLSGYHDVQKIEDLFNQIKKINDLKGDVMTYAEHLQNQGFNRGVSEGLMIARLEDAINLLKLGVASEMIAKALHLNPKDISLEKLEQKLTKLRKEVMD